MSFNLMTLGGIAAVVGIVIDDAIVVVEAIYAKVLAGHSPAAAVQLPMREVGPALVGSTMTPVVVFIPLAFLDRRGRAFSSGRSAMTMVIALLISLVLAVTWTPVTAGLLIRRRTGQGQDELEQGGPVLRRMIGAVRVGGAAGRCAMPGSAAASHGAGRRRGVWLYGQLETDFLPAAGRGGVRALTTIRGPARA